jgi:hypothetical protein
VDLLSEGDGGIVVGDLAGLGGVAGGEGNAVVDVEDAAGAAGRVDVAGGRDAVGLGVDLAVLPQAAAGDHGLGRGRGRGVLREVVGRVERPGDGRVELGIAVVGAVDNGELEAARVLEVQVQLAVLGVVADDGAGSDVGLEAIKAEGDNLLRVWSACCSIRPQPLQPPKRTYGGIGRDGGRDGALRAAVTGVRGRDDGDLGWVGGIRPAVARVLGDRGRSDERRKDEGSE